MAEIVNTIRLFIFLSLHYHLENWSAISQVNNTSVHESSTFICENGQIIDFLKVCDGISDCEEGSDEKCENDAILFYLHLTMVSPKFCSNWNYRRCIEESIIHLNLNGVFLNNDRDFSVPIFNSGVQKIDNLSINSNGPQINIFYTVNFTRRLMTQVNRPGQNISSYFTTKSRNENIRTPVFDSLTSNIYYISDTGIKFCDQNFVVCVNLESEFTNNPFFLTISVKYRLLFWIDRESLPQFQLFKYSLDRSSKPTVVRQDLKSPKWLTIDSAHDRLYWTDEFDDGFFKFYSSTFEGTDIKIISPGVPSPAGAPSPAGTSMSFAIFNESLYWPDFERRNIMKCSINDCDTPVIFKTVFSKNDYPMRGYFSLGTMIVDHRSLTPNKIKNPCDRSTCSHLCLATSETSYNCYCPGSDKPLPANTSNDYCVNNTVLAAYQSSLYVVGLLEDNFNDTILHKYTINISAISALTYNSLDGSIILTEEGRQRIYSWIPKTEELELILDDGVGTISSIEFDDHTNNLYWIDSRIHAIKVINMHSKISTSILEGNSSYSPIRFTLVPPRRYMAVLSIKDGSVVIIERISMDGGPYSRTILFEDDEKNDIEDFSLHYVRESQRILFVDGKTKKIKYFPDEKSEKKVGSLSVDSMLDIRSITTLETNSIIWSGDDLSISRSISSDDGYYYNRQRIPLETETTNLSLETSENSFVKLTNVLKHTVEPRLAKCLQNDRKCEKLCVLSMKYQKFTCLCPKGETLINGTSCEKLSRLDIATMATDNETQSNLLYMQDRANVKAINPLQEKEAITSITPSTRVESHQNSSPQNLQFSENRHEELSSHTSSGVYIFHSSFIAILAATLGVVVGYLLRGRLNKPSMMRLFPESGTLELSRMTSGSASTSTLIRTS